MPIRFRFRVAAGLVLALAISELCAVPARAASEQQSLEELRNTVVNLLQALVDQGVMTKDKADALVKQAQQKAAADTAATAKPEEGAVRVTYVPEIVKDEIRAEVAKDLKSQVADDVVARAKEEKWGVPGALPDWLTGVRVGGEVKLRGEGVMFGKDNARGLYLNIQSINANGGILKAGTDALLNTSTDRYRGRVLARLGIDADLASGVTAGVRFATGTLPASEWQTMGTTGNRYQSSIDLAYLRWDGKTRDEFPWITMQGGRTLNPYLAATDFIFHRDLDFDGVSMSYRLPFADGKAPSHAFQEAALSYRDKWLLAGQLGGVFNIGETQRLRLALAYYDFHNVQGVRNALNSNLTDFTAPQFVQVGNTMFDIRNDLDPSTNLFAIAGKYRLVDAIVTYDVPLASDMRLTFLGDYVKNRGWTSADVLAVSGLSVAARTTGYQAELGVGRGSAEQRGGWRAYLTYRYLQRDAVLDAFTDQDFHGGGTDAKGFIVGADFNLVSRVWLRARYLTADQIDGAPLAVDVIQVDLNSRF